MITLALLFVAGAIVLFLATVFIVALIQTIKEMQKPAVGFNAGLGFGGDLGVKLIKKGTAHRAVATAPR